MVAEAKRGWTNSHPCVPEMADRRLAPGREEFRVGERGVGDAVMIASTQHGLDAGRLVVAIREIRRGAPATSSKPIERRDLKGMAEIRRAAGGVPGWRRGCVTLRTLRTRGSARVRRFASSSTDGGITPAKRIAAVGRPRTSVSTAAASRCNELDGSRRAFYASTPGGKYGRGGIRDGLNASQGPVVPVERFRIRDGHVNVPTGPVRGGHRRGRAEEEHLCGSASVKVLQDQIETTDETDKHGGFK